MKTLFKLLARELKEGSRNAGAVLRSLYLKTAGEK